MGQKHQTLIRYRNDEIRGNNDINICTIHNQWGYGRIPIYSLAKIAMFNKKNTVEGQKNFNSLTDDSCCYINKIETILSLISVDYTDGFISNFKKYNSEQEFVPMDWCDNDDGYLLIDLTRGNNIHYAFVSGKCEYDRENSKTLYKAIKGKKYFKEYEKDYNTDIHEKVENFLKIIDENCILMSDEDIEVFNFQEARNIETQAS